MSRAPNRGANDEEFQRGTKEAKVGMIKGVIGMGFHIGTEGACYTADVMWMQGPIVSGTIYLLGATGPEMLKSSREATHGHCGSIQATCSVDYVNPFAAVAEEIALCAMMSAARHGFSMAGPSLRATETSVPSHTEALPMRSRPSTEGNLFNSYSGSRARGGG